MPWYTLGLKRRVVPEATEPPAIVRDALAAAAYATRISESTIKPQYSTWQQEAWSYYDELGEFRYAIDWKAEMLSRVRLRVGRIVPGQDEPELLDDGIAVDLLAELGNGLGGQSEMMSAFGTQLGVVGDSYLIGETTNGVDNWRVYSADEIRVKTRKYEVIKDDSSAETPEWRPVVANALIVRVWKPHKRMRHVADSAARSMRGTMRELELVNRKIQAQYLSRLASAGVFLMADEVNFPVREQFAEAEDPFVLEWIETAREAIATPGTAAAAIPIPMRVPMQYIEGFKFIDFATKDDDKIIEKRESVIRRLAMQADVPAEILLGTSGMNHWGAWQIEESAIKTHISTDAEIIVHALTIGYLWPRLRALGEETEGLVVWYDTSELVLRPDRSVSAIQAYDRGELSGAGLRTELGLDESDAPSIEELRAIILKKIAMQPGGMEALAELINDPTLRALVESAGEEDAPIEQPEEAHPIPDAPVKQPDVDVVAQARAIHRVSFTMDNWSLYHPSCCDGGLTTCPVTVASRSLKYRPGTLGDYECWLSASGMFTIGKQTFSDLNAHTLSHIRQLTRKSSNGAHTRT